MSRPDLALLNAFLAVAEAHSFRRAAAKLGVTPSTLSHSIQTLEGQTQLRLFNRTTRNVALTEAGEHLFARLSPAFGDIDLALDSLNAFREHPHGTVRISAPHTAIAIAIAPKLGMLARQFPDIRLELLADEGFIDIIEQGFDAGVRMRNSIHQDMLTVPISPPTRLAIVASPSYLSRHGIPSEPADLLRHRCIGWRKVSSGEHFKWPFEKNGDQLQIAVNSHLLLDSAELMVQAALVDAGIAFALEELVLPHIAAGRLIQLLDDWCAPCSGFYLYYPNRRNHSRALQAIIDLLRYDPESSGAGSVL